MTESLAEYGGNPVTRRTTQQSIDGVETWGLITKIANSVGKVINRRKLFTVIKNNKFVYCKGWKMLANRLGYVPEIVALETITDTKEMVDESTKTFKRRYKVKATAQLRDRRTGNVYSQAIATSSNWEKNNAYPEDFAVEGMAETRAIGRSCKNAFDWIMEMAGYSDIPAEEYSMDFEKNKTAKEVEQTQKAKVTPVPEGAKEVKTEKKENLFS